MDIQPRLRRDMDGERIEFGLKDEPTHEPPRPAARPGNSLDYEILAISTDQLAERVGVAIPTAREWRRLGRIPPGMRRAARALVLGDLGVIDPAWAGWSIRNGILHSPDGGDYVFSMAEVMSLPFIRRRLAETLRHLEEARRPPTPPEPLTQQNDWVSQKWTENPVAGEDAENARLDALLRERAENRGREHDQWMRDASRNQQHHGYR